MKKTAICLLSALSLSQLAWAQEAEEAPAAEAPADSTPEVEPAPQPRAAPEASPAPAADLSGKEGYSIFNPTPKEKMRELSTDRPDQTESPYTVDAGHIQLELDLVNIEMEKEEANGVTNKYQSSTYLAPNIKIGLCNKTDLQIMHGGYITQNADFAGVKQDEVKGAGDTTLRLKYNVYGNDGGKRAFAVMPFVKFGTGDVEVTDHKKTEYGLILPLALDLGNGFGIGTMLEFDYMKNQKDDGMHLEFIASLSFAQDWSEHLGTYFEIFSQQSYEKDADDHVTQFDLGMTYACGDNDQFDAGVNLGLSEAAPDTNPFIGYTKRW